MGNTDKKPIPVGRNCHASGIPGYARLLIAKKLIPISTQDTLAVHDPFFSLEILIVELTIFREQKFRRCRISRTSFHDLKSPHPNLDFAEGIANDDRCYRMIV